MPFRLRNSAVEWFKDIRGALGSAPMFDMYYFCLVTGLGAGRITTVPDSETSELIDSFPADYSTQGRLIIALFLRSELKRQGVTLSERAAVNTCIRRLVDPNTPSRLSAEGLRIMNQYSHGGFEILSSPDWFPDRPRTLHFFLSMFHRRLNTLLTPQTAAQD
jgi:hypothetical protein